MVTRIEETEAERKRISGSLKMRKQSRAMDGGERQ